MAAQILIGVSCDLVMTSEYWNQFAAFLCETKCFVYTIFCILFSLGDPLMLCKRYRKQTFWQTNLALISWYTVSSRRATVPWFGYLISQKIALSSNTSACGSCWQPLEVSTASSEFNMDCALRYLILPSSWNKALINWCTQSIANTSN